MENEDSKRSVAANIKLLHALEAGTLDSLECPVCHSMSVSVRFTHAKPDEYRTWFVCAKCQFKLRVQNTGVPPFFTEERVDEYLEAYDADLFKKRRFAD
jgi:hypothetical protein